MTDSNYIKVFTGSFIVVQRISEMLNASGISPVIKDETESGRLAGFGASIQGLQEIYVHEDELDKAVEIVENVNAEF
ncbi:MAG: putative signal transducing protein [Flavobacteriales bacterium]